MWRSFFARISPAPRPGPWNCATGSCVCRSRAFHRPALNTFDRYLLREWLQILGMVLVVMLGLVLIQVMYGDLSDLLAAGASLSDVGVYMAVAIPSYLSLLLPLSLLVSLLYAMGQFHRHHEFTALRAAGVGLRRITAPIWVVGVLCCALSGWLNASVVPWSVEESRALLERLQFAQQSQTQSTDRIGAVTSVAFDNHAAGRMWFFNRFSRFTQRAYGVSVSMLRVGEADRRERSRLVAAQAWRAPDGRGWIFREGYELSFDETTGEVLKPEPFVECRREDFAEDPQLMLLIDRRPVDLSLFELERLIDYLRSIKSPKIAAYAVRYHSLLASALAPLIVIGLAVPFAVSGVRTNPAVGVSKSLGLFLVYYALANLGGSMALKGYVSAPVAAWLPNLGMMGLAAWLMMRMR